MPQSSQTDWIALIAPLAGISLIHEYPEKPAVKKAIKRSMEAFEADFTQCAADLDFIFNDPLDVEDATRDNVALLRRWHLNGDAPSIPAMAAYACNLLVPNAPDNHKAALMAAAVLAQVDNPQPYHNNMHFRKVLIQTLRMIVVHNSIFEGTDRALDQTQIMILLIAACIHDLGHDGQGNTVRGVFEPGRLERRSFDLARPWLVQSGLEDAGMLRAIRILLLCTEVTPLGDPANPMNQAKSAYRYHYLGEDRRIEALNLDEDLKDLERDADLALMAVLLHEADIATSAGLNYALTRFETKLLHREIDAEAGRPSHVLEFLNKVCKRRMITDAGQKLYAANMARIYALAESDVRAGDEPLLRTEQSQFLYPHGTEGQDSSQKSVH